LDVVARRAESAQPSCQNPDNLILAYEMIEINSLGPDDWERWRDMRLNALAEAPYAFCSALGEWQDAGEHNWRERLSEVSLNLVAQLDGDDVGMVSGMASEDEVELLSMWVAPSARGRCVGDALIGAIVEWASSERKPRLVLRVLHGNEKAESLYVRHGFEHEQSSLDSNVALIRERLMVWKASRIPN
jgi:GNAT superfamily N-acetyltransferase